MNLPVSGVSKNILTKVIDGQREPYSTMDRGNNQMPRGKTYHMYRLSKTMAPTKRIPPTLTPETKATGSSWEAVVATPVGKFLISNK